MGWVKWRRLQPVGVSWCTIILAITKTHRLKPAPLLLRGGLKDAMVATACLNVPVELIEEFGAFRGQKR